MPAHYNELLDYMKTLEVIDTHEHLPIAESYRDPNADVLSEFLIHYFSVDLVSAGLPRPALEAVRGQALSIEEKWKLVEPYWEQCAATGYGQSLAIAARDIYGIEQIDRDSIAALNAAFKKGLATGHYKKVLKDMCGIRLSVLDPHTIRLDEDVDRDYFVTAYKTDTLIRPQTVGEISMMEEASGIAVRSFKNYLEACDALIEGYAKDSGILKCTLAYQRGLAFPHTGYAEAEAGFNSILNRAYYTSTGGAVVVKDTIVADPGLAFENYMMHYILAAAHRKGLVLQIHTGMQEGNGNLVQNSNPALLNNLFFEYDGVKFDVFHMGLPYQNELAVLAKMFPNVTIDMCWAHIISPIAAQTALYEWLEMLPVNKICGFGGDYCLVDGVYGHLVVARQNIARALARKVDEGNFGLQKAKDTAKALLCGTPATLYGI